MREEPAAPHRFFVNDLTGPLYVLDPKTKAATKYLDLNGRAHGGVFRRFTFETGLASGFISFEFDPDYARNGRFYTIHLEDADAAVGDSAAGEQRTAIRSNPQRLDTVAGKILRIIPDLGAHVESSTVSENGRYRIPRDNPFTSVDGARKEIWAYGLRNPHRLSWDVDPANRANPHLIAAVIGFRTWETVVIIRKGANYGYPVREDRKSTRLNSSH